MSAIPTLTAPPDAAAILAWIGSLAERKFAKLGDIGDGQGGRTKGILFVLWLLYVLTHVCSVQILADVLSVLASEGEVPLGNSRKL